MGKQSGLNKAVSQFNHCSCVGLKGNTYGEIKSHLGSITHNVHAHSQRAWLAREKLYNLKMMKSPLNALRYSTLCFPDVGLVIDVY